MTVNQSSGDQPRKEPGARLHYYRLPDFGRKEDKLDFLSENNLGTVDWQRLIPNNKHTWLRSETDDEFYAFIPLGTKEAKRAREDQAHTVFKTYSGGVKTNRDWYVYDFRLDSLVARVKRFIEDYNAQVDRYKRQDPKPNIDDFVDYGTIKWGASLKQNLKRGRYASFMLEGLRRSLYRPFVGSHLYFSRMLNERVYQQPAHFPNADSELDNRAICVSGIGSNKPFQSLMVRIIPCLDMLEKTQCFPFYTYDPDGSNRRENITDWALAQFRERYSDPAISKWDIFHYVYALLHHPGYRERYALDLKRSLPRIPFVPAASADLPPKALGGPRGVAFHAFARAGRQLADLHLSYESAQRYELDWQITRSPVDYRVEKMRPGKKSDAESGGYKVFSALKYNETLTLRGIPERAFAYRLGNRSALDWIVDQYRVKTDKRSGITHDPNGYSDDPQYILKLIERVITVSLRTVDIV